MIGFKCDVYPRQFESSLILEQKKVKKLK
jgi:hypothetical protein